jgi:hypothetical protein
MAKKKQYKLKKPRNVWHRKPQTQVVPNEKAKESKNKCRNKVEY